MRTSLLSPLDQTAACPRRRNAEPTMAQLVGPLRKELADSLSSCRVLVVGAGGIGCELLKNLVLTGFKNIEVIDLDTIDVSNLNRQFLFQKKHVGKSKAQVAKESVLRFCPSANITAYHDSIMNPDYNVEFFRNFQLVMNALDNRAARNHVNRMCLAADIPLIESGTAGYLGQVTVIKKGQTECYECQPKPTQKTFPGCTIRNTPSEPIHCIVWAKYLFNQLFGEEDADQEVSPDTADPEVAWNPADAAARATASNKDGDIKRVSTKEWARSTGYDPVKLFNKLFKDDIMYLLTMDKLWKKRKAPLPLDWTEIHQLESSQEEAFGTGLKDQQVLGVQGYAQLFHRSVETLRSQLIEKGEGAELVWDKDDPPAMDFVTAAANLRMNVFSMNMKSRFDVKSMAGNIIPAIATTNAVIAGLIVLEALKTLNSDFDQCRTVNLQCCSFHAQHNFDGFPNNNKFLSDFGIRNGSRLQADDFLQDYTLLVNLIHSEELEKDVEFEVVGDAPDKAPVSSVPEEGKNIANGNKDSAQPSTSSKAAAEDDDVLIVDSDEEPSSSTMETSLESSNRKRKHHDADTDDAASKRKRLDQQPADDDEDIIALD
ncbi:SUMO-activating enzyme subunit 2-like [Sinocyclocheilus anshuiensis]|uniref:SUMO-activating enzyme subunit 2-like n=1 Tax=Sinocyclocheilus anshuiensis TaxID=1608454 RepID=UPI0007B9941C|nr:PREDICTED: SUMO-activating enzyme subunit 2-like [Sinocyclocheilus anshuiensis]